MPKGNHNARGQKGNAGGRPPKKDVDRLDYPVNVAVNSQVNAALLRATREAGFQKVVDFVRFLFKFALVDHDFKKWSTAVKTADSVRSTGVDTEVNE